MSGYAPRRGWDYGEQGAEQHGDCDQCSNIDACGFCEGPDLPSCKFYVGPPPPTPSSGSEIFHSILKFLRII